MYVCTSKEKTDICTINECHKDGIGFWYSYIKLKFDIESNLTNVNKMKLNPSIHLVWQDNYLNQKLRRNEHLRWMRQEYSADNPFGWLIFAAISQQFFLHNSKVKQNF